MDLGVTHLQRETYHASMLLTEQLLEGLGLSRRQANHAVSTFQAHHERELALGHVAYKEAVAKTPIPPKNRRRTAGLAGRRRSPARGVVRLNPRAATKAVAGRIS